MALLLFTWLQACANGIHEHSGAVTGTLEGKNAQQAQAIQATMGAGKEPYSFAVTSDPHEHHLELRRVLDHMRADTSIRFVVVCGDVTARGKEEEMLEYIRIMDASGLPYLTVIGNREHLDQGSQGFEKLFGARNLSFLVGSSRLVLFDNVVKESRLALDTTWLNTAIDTVHDSLVLMFMHVQPSDPSLADGPLKILERIIARHRPAHVFMGHNHYHRQGSFADGTPYTTVSWPVAGEYVKVRVEDLVVQVERIRLGDEEE